MMFKDFLNASLNRIGVPSQAKFVEFGYGQVEPNHVSAQRNGKIYAQLPAAPEINILENGQFVKYDYAANGNGIGQVDFEGKGEWMLVYNEIKLYRDHVDGTKQWDCEFAMIKDDYQARIYSPYDWEHTEQEYKTRYLNGVDEKGSSSYVLNSTVELNRDGKTVTIDNQDYDVVDLQFVYNGVPYTLVQEVNQDGNNVGMPKVIVPIEYHYDDVTKDVEDYYEWGFTNDPWTKLGIYREKKMRPGTAMVPRVFKTDIGDHFTTNMINETELEVGDLLYVGANGILSKTKNTGVVAANEAQGILKTAPSGDMTWQVVKVYTMPDGQRGVKVMRIA